MSRAIAVGVLCLVLSLPVYAAYIPSDSAKYKSFLIRQARYEFGVDAPIPLFAAQLHQESHWNPLAESPYAQGIAQFTPDTADWISTIYSSLRPSDVWDAKWGIRALITYDKHLLKRTKGSTPCDDWAMALAAYNGGLGWINRDSRLAKAAGDDPTVWWGSVENYSNRAEWAFKENRSYPDKIIYRHQAKYLEAGWTGVTVCIETVAEVTDEPVVEVVQIEDATMPSVPEVLPIEEEPPQQEKEQIAVEHVEKPHWLVTFIERVREYLRRCYE